MDVQGDIVKCYAKGSIKEVFLTAGSCTISRVSCRVFESGFSNQPSGIQTCIAC